MDEGERVVLAEGRDLVARWRAEEMAEDLSRRRRDGIANAILELDQSWSAARTRAFNAGLVSVLCGAVALFAWWTDSPDARTIFGSCAGLSAAWAGMELGRRASLVAARIKVLGHLHDAGFRWSLHEDHALRPTKPVVSDKFALVQELLAQTVARSGTA